MKAKNAILGLINRLGNALPRPLRRRIADFPGVLSLVGRLSSGSYREIETPEGHVLCINPMFHQYLDRHGVEGYEPLIRRAVIRLTRPGMVAYDIGANVGIFSFLFASRVGPQGAVHSFEPERNNYRCLERSLALNAMKNLHLDTRAVGRRTGVEVFDRRGGAFSGRLVGKGARYEATQNVEQVATVGLDTALRDEGLPPPDILKIDVEGNEAMVLEGMRGILEEHGPLILCELHTHLGESSDITLGLLEAQGYSICEVEPLVKENLIVLLESEGRGSRGGHVIAFKERSDLLGEDRAGEGVGGDDQR